MQFKLLRFIIRSLMSLIAKIEVYGLENLPEGNYMLASNHLGRLDTAVLVCVLDRSDIIMAAAEKYKNHPLFGALGRAVDAIWLNRFDVDYHALRLLLARMKQGGLMAIAPEGTRSKTEALQEGKPGVVFLASHSGYPVVPVAVFGTEDRAIVENLKHFRRSRIVAIAGKPFTVQIPRDVERATAIRQATDEVMCQIAALLPEHYRGVYSDHPRLKELLANA